MLLIKISNTQSLNLKLNHELHLDWPILLKSNKIYKSFCNEKDPHAQKKIFERQFKIYCNLILTLLRETKESYYKQYFRDNQKNLILVWQTIKGDKHEKQV